MAEKSTSQQEVQVVFLPDEASDYVPSGKGVTLLNLAAFLGQDGVDWRRIHSTVDALAGSPEATGGKTVFNRGFSEVERGFVEQLKQGRVSLETCEQLKIAMAQYVGATKDHERKDWLATPHITPFRKVRDGNVLRYGNVELRVIENYLIRRDELFSALEKIAGQTDEASMYKEAAFSSHLSADDPNWCLRRLMTNAGFYLSEDIEQAKKDLAEWCERYLEALVSDTLVANPVHFPFCFSIQHHLWTQDGQTFDYCTYPGPFEFYEWLAGQNVLFVSPLARFVNEQVQSGNLWRLYKDYEMPEFALKAIEAPVSTWPNRPGGGWGESFEALCKSIDAEFEAQPFDIFVASCGCYGLPVSRYVSQKHGCRAFYLGNMTNALFGVKQNSTANFMADRANADMWIRGDLSKFANISRIDGGRYV
ncbi:MAG: hypothetical protein WA989_16270 [Henriciella sp.]|uniref:hypothetical protein n=1 Tax=Henriciella sp. TaxID=1968823 RepID=UPI003C78E72D